MSVLLRFLLVSILILYAIRALLRYLLPMLFQSLVNKAQQQGQHNRGVDYEQAGIDFVLTYDNHPSKAYLSPPPQ